MAISEAELREIALSMDGVMEKPNFDRAAFKLRPNFTTLAPEKTKVNLPFLPEEQGRY